jgi:hypothetical protein
MGGDDCGGSWLEDADDSLAVVDDGGGSPSLKAALGEQAQARTVTASD